MAAAHAREEASDKAANSFGANKKKASALPGKEGEALLVLRQEPIEDSLGKTRDEQRQRPSQQRLPGKGLDPAGSGVAPRCGEKQEVRRKSRKRGRSECFRKGEDSDRAEESCHHCHGLHAREGEHRDNEEPPLRAEARRVQAQKEIYWCHGEFSSFSLPSGKNVPQRPTFGC